MKLFFPGYSGRNFLLLSFVSLFTILIPVQVFCQNNEFYYKTYTTEHGLPNNHVINIIQDKTGILWIATFDGLSKFDGYEFKNYFGNPKDTNSIGVAQLAELALDLTDNLWILARGKFLYKFNRKNEKFLNFSPKLNSIAPILDQQSLAKDQSGNFWILSNEGMLRFNPVSYQTQLIPFQDESLISEMRWGSMSFDNKGDLWGVNSDMVFHFKLIYEANKQPVLRLSAKYRCDAGQHKMILQTNFPNFHFYHNIIHSGQNNLWMTTNYGLFFLDRALGRFIKYQDKLYSHDFIDNQIVKWSDFESGLHIYYPGSKREFRLNGLTDCVTESSFVDNQGNIWSSAFSVVSGEGSGLQKTVPTSPVFRNIILKNKLNGSKNCAVFSVSKDKNGSIWVGTRDYNYMLVVSPDG